MQPTSLIVIAVDGLRASALGAYGNAWYGAGSFDRLASESTLFDQFLLDSHDPGSFYRGFRADQLAEAMDKRGLDSLLVTDSPEVRGLKFAHGFDRVCLTPDLSPESPADEPSQTATAATLALMLDQIEQTNADAPVFVWTHLRFASGPWDAPLRLADDLLSEDDPDPPASLVPPHHLDTHTGADSAFAATVRYAAQVLALDHCLGAVVDALDEILGQARYTLALLGVRGFSLGEHGRVGIQDPRPYSEMRHAPLIVRPAGDRQHHRTQHLTTPSDLARILTADDLQGESSCIRPAVLLRSPEGDAWQDQDWRLVSRPDAPAELYSKPDDRWEMNDVAVRHEHVVEELMQQMSAAQKKK